MAAKRKPIRKKLTDKGLEKMTRPKAGRVEIWDTVCPGFGIRVTAGAIAYQVMYRIDGELRRETLGRYGGSALTLSAARKMARDMIDNAKAGVDPREKAKQEKEERTLAQANTFAAVRDRFIAEYAKLKNWDWQEVERYFKRDLADWNERPIDTITRRQITAAIDKKAKDGGPYAANKLHAHMRKLFAWATSKYLLAASPFADMEIEKRAEIERDRVLTEREIARLWSAWEELTWPFGPMLKLLLITGQRRDEVAGMQWEEIRARPVGAATEATAASPSATPIEWYLENPRQSNEGRALA